MRTLGQVILALTLAFGVSVGAQDRRDSGERRRIALLPMAIEGSAIVVTEATPGGDVVFVGFSRELKEDHWSDARHHAIRRAAAGSARLDIGRDLPQQSFWIAVDLQSGRYGAIAPEGSTPWRLRLGGSRQDGGRSVDLATPFAQLLWIRPRVGAWEATASDGAQNDSDGLLDGKSALSLAHMRPEGSFDSAPGAFSEGDVLFIFDPYRMELSVTRVGVER